MALSSVVSLVQVARSIRLMNDGTSVAVRTAMIASTAMLSTKVHPPRNPGSGIGNPKSETQRPLASRVPFRHRRIKFVFIEPFLQLTQLATVGKCRSIQAVN